jgi:elongation factor G
MSNYSKDKIRNIALIGHGGEGKTSLLEAILYFTKGIERLGKIDDGNTVSDYDPEEISRKMSIGLSMCYAKHRDYKINFIDVPGFFDFEGEMVSAMNVAGGALIVTQANGSLSVGTEKAIDYCMRHKIPMMVFINGVNKENSNYFKTIEAIQEKYGKKVAALDFPIMDGYNMTGYVDVIAHKGYDNDGNEIAIPEFLRDAVHKSNVELSETAAGASEELMEKFFANGKLTREDRLSGLKLLISESEFIPVIAGVAVGKPVIADVLDLLIDLIPYNGELRKKKALKGDELVEVECDEKAPFSCQIFKTIIDPFVGKLLLFKAYSGSVKSGDILHNMNKDENEKISSLYILQGKQQKTVDVINAGDIGAFAKLSCTTTSDTLCSEDNLITFPKIQFPIPTFTLAISSDDKGGADKVVDGLRKMTDEDCTFYVGKDTSTYETIIRGMGETQIDVLLKKIKNKYKAEATLVEPKVAYRETIRKTVEQQGKCKKQNGGSGLYGDVRMRFEPAPEVEDFEFAVEVVGGSVPKQYYPSVEKGIKEIKAYGILAGYPMVNFRAILYDGSYHPVDSKEAAFIEAAKIAFKEGIPNANPVLLEPIVNVKVTIPTEFMGDIMGDITKRRGKVFGMETEGAKTIISGEVPQSEMMRYTIDLRSMTQGRGKFTTEFARYDEVPASATAKIIQEAGNTHHH